MSIHMTLTKADKTVTQKDFCNWPECAVWLEAHHGEYTEVDVKEIDPVRIKQGRENNG